MIVSAGASGAIFGVFGVMLAFVLRPRRTVPRAALKALRGNIFFFLALNLWLGVKTPAIDLAAHGGGLVSGFVLGALLTHELTADERRAALRRTAPVGAFAALALLFLTFVLRGTVPDFQGDAEKFDAVEHRVFAAFEDAEKKAAAGEITDAQYADIIERDVLGPWRGIGLDPARYRRLPRKVQQWVRDLADYHAMREHSWQSMVHALRTGDQEEFKRGMDEFQRADEMAQEMSKQAKQKN
jgi:rhomboid protease GluP